mmetsp:Transcript_51177/g.129943  ORF Transcript_51177/g.129943 Transcript_51177/m.129943 type:complete len:86 (-) Transcript_51177:76-333(-)
MLDEGCVAGRLRGIEFLVFVLVFVFACMHACTCACMRACIRACTCLRTGFSDFLAGCHELTADLQHGPCVLEQCFEACSEWPCSC